MSLLEYLRLVVKRGWIVVLIAALAAAAMIVYSQRQTPVYRSTMQVLFEPAAASQDTGAAMNSLLRSYVVRVYTTDIAAEIVSELNMSIGADALKAGTEISAVPDQSLIKIEVNDTNGEFANLVALAWGQKLIDQQNFYNTQQPANEQIIATPQDYPRFVLFRPKTLSNALLGGVAGALLGIAIVYFLETRAFRVVRTRHDLAQVNVLGAVPFDPV